MDKSGVAVLAVVFIALFPLTMGMDTERPNDCYKFSDILQISSANCHSTCLTPPTSDQHLVYGTDHYSQDSDLCWSAIHAGILEMNGSGGDVFYEKDPNQSYVSGSTNNGITSHSKENLETTYRFIANGTTPAKEALATPILSLDSRGKDSVSFSWTLREGSPAATNYTVTHQFQKHKACATSQPGKISREPTTSTHVTVTELDSYAQYRMCVIAVNDGGENPEACRNYETDIDVPRVSLKRQGCTKDEKNSGKILCFAKVPDTSCMKYNGPDFRVQVKVITSLQCADSNNIAALDATINTFNWADARFNTDNLIPGQDYEATLTPVNKAGEGTPVRTSFITEESKPPQVMRLTAFTLSSSAITIVFDDPCPPNGLITHLMYDYEGSGGRKEVPATTCKKTENYDRCIDVEGLTQGKNYTFEVAVRNSADVGEFSYASATPKETEPGPPDAFKQTRKETSVTAELTLPLKRGGTLHNCSIQLDGKKIPYTAEVTSKENILKMKINELERGRRYTAEAHCCNNAGCGPDLITSVSTVPLVPIFDDPPVVKKKTKYNITLTLPRMKEQGDGDRYFAILVQHIARSNMSDANSSFIQEFIQTRNKSTDHKGSESEAVKRKKLEAPEECEAPKTIYIAGIVTSQKESQQMYLCDLHDNCSQILSKFGEFTVGGGEFTVGGDIFPNCRLTPQELYKIGIIAEVNLDGESRYAVKYLLVKAENQNKSGSVLSIVMSVTVIILLMILVILAIKFRKKFYKPREREAARLTPDLDPDNDIPARENFPVESVPNTDQALAIPMAVRAEVVPPPAPVEESIYANVSPESFYSNAMRCVPKSEIEAYLGQVINSIDVMNEFMSVADTFPKSMDYGRLVENGKKNRYRNNLPYDETRVKLSVIGNDPFSDYINANHVEGFIGTMRYIATQGPKEENVNTIQDFWRMICEQEVTVIIMVANFVEGGKSKVGEYFSYEEALTAGEYTVNVVNTQEFPKYNISTVEISKGSVNHTVNHYHYKSWPDHGVPTEVYTLGSMLRTVINSHYEGCIVVHCSAGIGRTGTVLMVLLLHKMLLMHDGIEPLHVLRRLRDCRARLVENLNQYNLVLKLYEEVEFGALHTIQAQDLPQYITQPLKEKIRSHHAKAKSLPNNLKFSSASNSECISMNRSTTVFPADSCRIFLQMMNGQSSSQYINAVNIDGIHKSSSVIVTEHPILNVTHRFWRLVMEKKCHSVVFINSFDGLEMDFPVLLPVDDQELTMGSYSLFMEVVACCDALVQTKLRICSENMNKEFFVKVYQVTSWQYGRELPSSPEALLGVCDLILKNLPTDSDAGPTLLTCGDGVTGCGLMAALINITDQLRRYQEVNIYRTLVRLLRVRKEFFPSPAQVEFLYEAAYCYADMYKDY